MAGNIHIIDPTRDFQKVARAAILDMDYKTLGVYVKILALGKKWQLNIRGLASTLHIGTDSVRAMFAKIEAAGYLRRKRVQGKDGKFVGWDYEISSVPLADLPVLPTSEENRHRENTDVGEKPTSEKSDANIDYNKRNIDLTINQETIKDTSAARFDFRAALLSLGVTAEVADAWLKIRHNKRASNTKIAFDGVAREIAKTGASADECIRMAVELSWQGFRADWYERNIASPSSPSSPSRLRQSKADDAFDNMMALGKKFGFVK